jgi:exodeoxyribonuclease V alpha subunit
MNYVEGILKSYLFFNETNAYSVLKIEITDTNEKDLVFYEPTIIICGFFPKLEQGSKYRFYGKIKSHPKYGTQYDAERYERIMDNTYDGLIDYLSSGIIKGIGPKTAKRIIDTLGLDALEKIANNPDILDTVSKFPKLKKPDIHAAILENRKMESTLIWLYGFQISPKMSMRIFQRYGIDTIDVIKQNPYVLIDDVEGIAFKRADEIGLKVGFSYDSPLRISAVLIYLLNEYANKYGDTYLEKDKLMEYTYQFLRIDDQIAVDVPQIENIIQTLINQKKIAYIDDKIGLMTFFNAEKKIAERLIDINSRKRDEYSPSLVENTISEFETIHGIIYTQNQREAILQALINPLTIITGGPGTGKTTIVKGIINVFISLNQGDRLIHEKIKLAAPTGKAAKRLFEATECNATTIHRLLGYDYLGHYTFDQNNPIDAKLVIIDEASMLDVGLANQLFQSVSSKTKIVIVGDDNQLPSVGPGQVLTDILECKLFPVVRLYKIHRQASDSSIIQLAYDILNQQLSENVLGYYHDRSYIRSHEEQVPSKIIQILQEAIEHGYDLWEDIEVLIPMYKGECGIDNINKLLQETFNKNNEMQSISYGLKTFYYHDKVMQLVNQPEDGIMNGDLGIISGILDEREMLVDFSGNVVKYNIKDFDNLTLAYAISIHKSQGSEFKMVILPIVRSYSMMLKRKLLYTAVTRAKEKLILIGEFGALKRGILGIESNRKTFLNQFLNGENQASNEKPLTIEDFL